MKNHTSRLKDERLPRTSQAIYEESDGKKIATFILTTKYKHGNSIYELLYTLGKEEGNNIYFFFAFFALCILAFSSRANQAHIIFL